MRRTLRQLRAQLRTMALMLAIAIFGLGVGTYIVVHQHIVWPSWVPVLGQREFILNARIPAVSGVLPGEGQAVTVSGVTVGEISGVSLRTGSPVVTMEIQPQYAGRIYADATVLLRPKTGLDDMVAELDPGSPGGGARLRSGATLSSANTLPTVQLDEILSQLDADTRDELELLVADAGQALGGQGGAHLADVLRRFDPLSRDVEVASRLLALRGVELRRLMGHLAQIATVLGDNEEQVTTFVDGNAGVWQAFATEDASLERAIGQLPTALRATDGALSHATGLGLTLRGTLTDVQPAARSLGPTLADLRPFFRATTPIVADQLRPFSVRAQPTARLLAPATGRLAAATPGLGTLATELNDIVNELAYKAPGQQSYLYYLPWANHDTNSVLSAQDGVGPVRRSLLLFNCGTLGFLNTVATANNNPTLTTLIDLLDLPSFSANCRYDSSGTAVPK